MTRGSAEGSDGLGREDVGDAVGTVRIDFGGILSRNGLIVDG